MIIILPFPSYNKKYFKRCWRENQNLHFMYNDFFSRESWLLCANLENYGTAGLVTDDKMAHALCMLDT